MSHKMFAFSADLWTVVELQLTLEDCKQSETPALLADPHNLLKRSLLSIQDIQQIALVVLQKHYYNNNTMCCSCFVLFRTAEGLSRLLKFSMEAGFCGNLGKESIRRQGPLGRASTSLHVWQTSWYPKRPQPVSNQSDNHRLRKSMQLPLVLLWCGGQSPQLKRYVWNERTADCGQDGAGAPPTH